MATDNKETKIVKAAPKKTDSHQDEQPRVTVKAAVIPQRNTKKIPFTKSALHFCLRMRRPFF